MSVANMKGVIPERNAVRHALTIERVRIHQCRKMLACTGNGVLQSRWKRELKASLGRAVVLTLALVDMGEAVPLSNARTDLDGCLLEAVDTALRNGDMPASETIARECMALIGSARAGNRVA